MGRWRHYRLFCLLEPMAERLGLGGPAMVVVTGLEKELRTKFSERDCDHVRQLGDEYRSRAPPGVSHSVHQPAATRVPEGALRDLTRVQSDVSGCEKRRKWRRRESNPGPKDFP